MITLWIQDYPNTNQRCFYLTTFRFLIQSDFLECYRIDARSPRFGEGHLGADREPFRFVVEAGQAGDALHLITLPGVQQITILVEEKPGFQQGLYVIP